MFSWRCLIRILSFGCGRLSDLLWWLLHNLLLTSQWLWIKNNWRSKFTCFLRWFSLLKFEGWGRKFACRFVDFIVESDFFHFELNHFAGWWLNRVTHRLSLNWHNLGPRSDRSLLATCGRLALCVSYHFGLARANSHMHHPCRHNFRWGAHLRAWIGKPFYRWGWGHFCRIVNQISRYLISDLEFLLGLWLWLRLGRLFMGHLDIIFLIRSHTVAVLMLYKSCFLDNLLLLRSRLRNLIDDRLDYLLLLSRVVVLFLIRFRWRRWWWFRTLANNASCLPEHLFLCRLLLLLLDNWNLHNRLNLNLKTSFILFRTHILILVVISTFILVFWVGRLFIITLLQILLRLWWWWWWSQNHHIIAGLELRRFIAFLKLQGD